MDITQDYLTQLEKAAINRPPYGENIIIKQGDKIIHIEDKVMSGNLAIYDFNSVFGGIRVSYTLGDKLNVFHSSLDPHRKKAKKLLKLLNIHDINKLMKVKTEHKDKVVINSDTETADGVIITDGRPLYLTPADCTGFCFVHPGTDVYGIFHAGRGGIGKNIASNFVHQFALEVEKRQGNMKDVIIILPPHIFGYEYPHENSNFFYSEIENVAGEMEIVPNWWFYHQQFAPQKDGIYYPDIGPAAIAQIREVLGNEVKIIVSGLSTYQGYGVSHSKFRDNQRNLIAIGKA